MNRLDCKKLCDEFDRLDEKASMIQEHNIRLLVLEYINAFGELINSIPLDASCQGCPWDRECKACQSCDKFGTYKEVEVYKKR